MREYYRRNYPLTAQSRAERAFNPGAGWVSALCYEPKVGRAVLEEMLAPYLSAGRILLVLHHRPVAVEADGDLIRAVTLQSTRGGDLLTVAADYVLDATDLGELLELGSVEHVIGAEARERPVSRTLWSTPIPSGSRASRTWLRSTTAPAKTTPSSARPTTPVTATASPPWWVCRTTPR